jgi:hypothetical protein
MIRNSKNSTSAAGSPGMSTTPQDIADQLARILPRSVSIFDVEIVQRAAANPKVIIRAAVGWAGKHRAEISGIGDDPAEAIVDLHNAARRFEVTP